MFDIFNVVNRFIDLLNTCFNMLLNGYYYDKKTWSKTVWDKVWHLEDEEYQMYRQQLNKEKLLSQIIEKPYYLTWWAMLDLSRDNIEQCVTLFCYLKVLLLYICSCENICILYDFVRKFSQ